MKRRITAFLGIAVLLCSMFMLTGCGAASQDQITAIADLDGKMLGVQTGVCYEDEIKDAIPSATWNYFQMPNDMIMALESNKITAYLIEEVGYAAQKFVHPELMRLEESAGTIDFVIAIGNNDKQDVVLQQVNRFIADATADGTVAAMYDYWITNWNPDTCRIEYEPKLDGANGTLRVATEGAYEPFSFMSAGELSGFDIEFVYRFCDAYGYIPEFYQVPFDTISAGTETGKYELGMNIVYTDERSDGAQLSDVYYSCDIVFVMESDDQAEAGFFAEIGDSFYKTFVKDDRWKMFAEGTGITVLITICAIIFGTALGFAAFLGCRKGGRVFNGFMSFLTFLLHSIPTVVLLMILFYIIFGSSHLSGTVISIIGFSFVFACAMLDMLQVGFGAISRGQVEASRALGYSDRQSFFRILLPQAAQHFLPIYGNEVVTLIKETAIVGYIAVLDLTKICDLVRSRTYEAFFALVATAVVYIIIESIMIFIVRRVQMKVDPRRRSDEKILKGIVQQE